MVYMFIDEDEPETFNYRGQRKSYIEQNYLLALDDEEAFFQVLVGKFGDIFTKLDRYDRVDFKTKNEEVHIEFKFRKVQPTTYNSLIIGQDKIQHFDNLMKNNPKIRCYYINQFLDGSVLCYKYKPAHKKDWETSVFQKQPLYHIPITKFKPFDIMKKL